MSRGSRPGLHSVAPTGPVAPGAAVEGPVPRQRREGFGPREKPQNYSLESREKSPKSATLSSESPLFRVFTFPKCNTPVLSIEAVTARRLWRQGSIGAHAPPATSVSFSLSRHSREGR